MNVIILCTTLGILTLLIYLFFYGGQSLLYIFEFEESAYMVKDA